MILGAATHLDVGHMIGGSIVACGTTYEQWNVVTLEGDGVPSPQVFSITGDQLGLASQALGIRLAGIPERAPIITNVDGGETAI